MALWFAWYTCIKDLRPACSRGVIFMWLILALAAMSVKTEHLGVTSLVRAIGLKQKCYEQFRHFFHSSGLKLDLLTECWIKIVLARFSPLKFGEYIILVADGLKVGKEGRKMPAVKKLHQESNNNSKPEYIWGHSFQSIAVLVTGVFGTVFAVPIVSRIHEGLVWSNRDKKTLIDKLVNLLFTITEKIQNKAILVADNYYANRKVILPLIKTNTLHLVSRIKISAVAYYPPIQLNQKKRRGRKKKYGDKITMRSFFNKHHLFISAFSPVYGEDKVTISYCCVDLLWRPVGQIIRFVLVNHPVRGNIILMTTNIALHPIEVISIYGYRFKIEVAFKHALNTIGTYSYHFWMKAMNPRKRVSGNQHLHKESLKYRQQVERKIKAYHCYVQLGCITQGVLLYLSINYGTTVWAAFRSWLRTMRKDLPPSEMVVKYALSSSLPEFLVGSKIEHPLKKFITQNLDPHMMPNWRLYGS